MKTNVTPTSKYYINISVLHSCSTGEKIHRYATTTGSQYTYTLQTPVERESKITLIRAKRKVLQYSTIAHDSPLQFNCGRILSKKQELMKHFPLTYNNQKLQYDSPLLQYRTDSRAYSQKREDNTRSTIIICVSSAHSCPSPKKTQ